MGAHDAFFRHKIFLRKFPDNDLKINLQLFFVFLTRFSPTGPVPSLHRLLILIFRKYKVNWLIIQHNSGVYKHIDKT